MDTQCPLAHMTRAVVVALRQAIAAGMIQLGDNELKIRKTRMLVVPAVTIWNSGDDDAGTPDSPQDLNAGRPCGDIMEPRKRLHEKR